MYQDHSMMAGPRFLSQWMTMNFSLFLSDSSAACSEGRRLVNGVFVERFLGVCV